MNSEYMQENVLNILIKDEKNYKFVINKIEADYFESDYYRKIFNKLKMYIVRFKKPPVSHVYQLLNKEIEKDSLIKDIIDNIFNQDIDANYVIEELNIFIRQQQLKIGIISAAEQIENGDISAAEKCIHNLRKNEIVNFDRGSKLDSNFLSDNTAIETIPIGIDLLDSIGCCPTKKEMIALGALPGYGKSHFLTHLGKIALNTNHKVLHITLEMSEELQKLRYLQSCFGLTKRQSKGFINVFNRDENGLLSGIDRQDKNYNLSLDDQDIKNKMDKKLKKINTGNLIIKAFSSGRLTMRLLENYIESLIDYENFMPDLVMIDYPKKMKLNPRYLREELGQIYIELKGLADEYNTALAVVAQFNRDGKKSKERWLDESHLQEDFSLINEVAWFLTYNQTPSEYDNKLSRLFVSKGRNDVKNIKLLLSQDYECCQFALDSVLFSNNKYSIKE